MKSLTHIQRARIRYMVAKTIYELHDDAISIARQACNLDQGQDILADEYAKSQVKKILRSALNRAEIEIKSFEVRMKNLHGE